MTNTGVIVTASFTNQVRGEQEGMTFVVAQPWRSVPERPSGRKMVVVVRMLSLLRMMKGTYHRRGCGRGGPRWYRILQPQTRKDEAVQE